MENDAKKKLIIDVPLWAPDQVQEFGPEWAPFVASGHSSTPDDSDHLSAAGLSNAVEDGSTCTEAFPDYIVPVKEKRTKDYIQVR